MKSLALLCMATACAAQTAATGSISGVVRDAGSGTPVARAGVGLQLPGGKFIASQTDAQGEYTLSGIPAGTYRINAAGPLETGQASTPQQHRTVLLESGQKLIAVDFNLPSLGVISGRVLDEKDQPVPGAQVVPIEKLYRHGALEYLLTGGRVQTDKSGVYRLTGIPADTAFLVETRNKLPAGIEESDTPVDTFYPNVLAAEQAAEIVLSPGETRNGVDMRQLKLPAYCVDGNVQGAPESTLDVTVVKTTGVRSLDSRDFTPAKGKPDGTFHVCGLHRGQYAFTASGRAGAANPPFLAVATVEVTDHNVRDCKLVYAPSSTLSVEYVWDRDSPTQPSRLSALFTLRGRSIQVSFITSGGRDPAETVQLPPDDYTIDVNYINDGFYAKEITCGGRSLLHGTVSLGGAASCGVLRFVFAHDAASLTARVADKDGKPISEAYVAIIPESAPSAAEMSAAMTFGQTCPNGVYSSNVLRPGKYRVLATNDVIDMASNRVDRLWAAQSRGQEVELGANGSVQLKLEPQALR